MDKLLTLEEWAASVFGAHPPHIATLRRWARESLIFPAPQLLGRSYYVLSTARYIDPTKPIGAQAVKAAPRRGSLADRIMKERGLGKTA